MKRGRQSTALAPRQEAFLRHSTQDAETLALAVGQERFKVAFVTSSYDTAHEPVEEQVAAKVRELQAAFGADGPVEWSLWIVDDLPSHSGFSAKVEMGFQRCEALLLAQARLRCVPMTSAKPKATGLKGLALLDGMRAALQEGAQAIVYINLNLKVPAQLAATGLRALRLGRWDAAIGSRSPVDGGRVVGAGRLGRLKSKGFNGLVTAVLPSLTRFKDTNAPMKVFSADAAKCLVHQARIHTVTMDAEWLLILHERGFKVTIFPISWAQRPGSAPPWMKIPSCAWDVVKMKWRRRLQVG